MLFCTLQCRFTLKAQRGGAGHDDASLRDLNEQAALLQADLHFPAGEACLMAQHRRGAGAGAAGAAGAAAAAGFSGKFTLWIAPVGHSETHFVQSLHLLKSM